MPADCSLLSARRGRLRNGVPTILRSRCPPTRPRLQIIFHGPREGVLPFFEGLGFVCPERKGVAEFLQEVPTLAGASRAMLLEIQDAVCVLRSCLLTGKDERTLPAPTANQPLPPQPPAPPTDQQRFWAGNPGEWQFVSAQEIADEFYMTTEAGRDIMQALEVGGGG